MALKAFDENTTTQIVDSPDSLTLFGNLGPDYIPGVAYETFAQFDDFDDFHGYSRTDTLVRLGNFDVSVLVNYVMYEEPDSIVTDRTFYKKAEVTIINDWLVDTLTLNYTASY